jgi:hypothetical protein
MVHNIYKFSGTSGAINWKCFSILRSARCTPRYYQSFFSLSWKALESGRFEYNFVLPFFKFVNWILWFDKDIKSLSINFSSSTCIKIEIILQRIWVLSNSSSYMLKSTFASRLFQNLLYSNKILHKHLYKEN